jgi:hypothetical protein
MRVGVRVWIRRPLPAHDFASVDVEDPNERPLGVPRLEEEALEGDRTLMPRPRPWIEQVYDRSYVGDELLSIAIRLHEDDRCQLAGSEEADRRCPESISLSRESNSSAKLAWRRVWKALIPRSRSIGQAGDLAGQAPADERPPAGTTEVVSQRALNEV